MQHWWLKRIAPLVILSVLMFGSAVCSMAPHHMFHQSMHTNTAGPCSIKSSLTDAVVSSREHLILFGLLALIIVSFVFTKSFLETIEDSSRIPAWFLEFHNLATPLRNYLLLALSQGILHSRVH